MSKPTKAELDEMIQETIKLGGDTYSYEEQKTEDWGDMWIVFKNERLYAMFPTDENADDEEGEAISKIHYIIEGDICSG